MVFLFLTACPPNLTPALCVVINSRLRDFPPIPHLLAKKKKKNQRETATQQFFVNPKELAIWSENFGSGEIIFLLFQCKFHLEGTEDIRGVPAGVLVCPTKQQPKSLGMANPTSSSSSNRYGMMYVRYKGGTLEVLYPHSSYSTWLECTAHRPALVGNPVLS